MHIGLTSGCFDLVHVGHVTYLERCKALCEKLIVGVDCDAMVQAVKGPTRPVIPENERLAMIYSLAPVDAAFLLRELADLDRIVRQFGVTRVFKHEGYMNIEHVVGVEGTGADLVIVPDVPGLVSTSEIVKRILSAHTEKEWRRARIEGGR